jgi:hypothetical protein
MPATSHSRVLGMTHRNDLFSCARLLTPAIIGLTFAMSNAEALETLGRYTTVNPHAQTVVRDLLAVPVSVEFPQSITVGDAVARVLQDTGYSLSPATPAAPSGRHCCCFRCRQPIAHWMCRQFGWLFKRWWGRPSPSSRIPSIVWSHSNVVVPQIRRPPARWCSRNGHRTHHLLSARTVRRNPFARCR